MTLWLDHKVIFLCSNFANNADMARKFGIDNVLVSSAYNNNYGDKFDNVAPVAMTRKVSGEKILLIDT